MSLSLKYKTLVSSQKHQVIYFPMLARKVTCCPHCLTSFQVTSSQLRAANGAVRCGSCLQVFNATLYFNDQSPAGASEKSRTAPITRKNNHAGVIVKNKLVSLKKAGEKPKEQNSGSIPHLSLLETSSKQILRELEKKAFSPKKSNYKLSAQKLAWITITIFLSTALFLQYALFNKDTLSLDTRYREQYITLCQYLDCSLPPLTQTWKIKSMELIVRQHPEISEALLIDSVIINNSPYPQSFPLIDLKFTDINENIIAGRILYPFEYLGGELTGTRNMPSQQPIRLGLEIIDPGQEAVNYSLTFLPDKIP